MDDAVAAALIGVSGVVVGAGLSWFQAHQSANREDRRHREERLDERKVDVYGRLLYWMADVDGQLRDMWASFIKWGRHGGVDVKQAEYRSTTPPDSWVPAPRLDGALRAQLDVFAPAHIVKLALSLDFVAIRTADEALSLGRHAISTAEKGRTRVGPGPADRPEDDVMSRAELVIGGFYKKWRVRQAVLLNAVRYDMNNREVLPTDRGYLDWDAFPDDSLSDIPASDLPDPVRAAIAMPSSEPQT